MATAKDLLGAGFSAVTAMAIIGDTGYVAATGTTQGTAALLPYTHNIVVVSASNTGVILPANTAIGDTITIYNSLDGTVQVYPPTGSRLNGGSVNAAVSFTPPRNIIVQRLTSVIWGYQDSV